MYKVEFFKRRHLIWRGKRVFKTVLVTQYYWRVRHRNGNIVATGGEGYYNKKDCETALLNMIEGFALRNFTITYDN